MKNQTNLTRDLLAHGLYHRSCGVAAITLALRLRERPVTHAERVAGSMKKSGMSAMGALVREGLAAYEPSSKKYDISLKGLHWLMELGLHGFLNAKEVAA